jgi:hypothetical protein
VVVLYILARLKVEKVMKDNFTRRKVEKVMKDHFTRRRVVRCTTSRG